jgi:hypothetical protein
MELLLTLPLLAILLLGLLEFCLLFYARGEVVEACRAGARIATYSGSSLIEVEEEVLAQLGPRLRESAEVYASIPDNSGDEVVVSVRVPMSSAAPDLLWPVGFSLKGESIVCSARMLKE